MTLDRPPKIGAAFWVQRTSWPALREAALWAEASGFDSLWVDDHLLNDEGPEDDPKFECWTTLAALAAITHRPTVGALVGATTLRNPGLVAKMVATLDHISGGRAVLGLGAGWLEREHEAFGFDFGASPGERLDRLDEALGLLRRLLDGERVTHDGRFYHFQDAVSCPRPLQPRLPILVGGSGPHKTLRIVACRADLWNAYGSLEGLTASAAILDQRCAEIGRDPASIERTANLNVVLRHTRAEAEAAWTALLGRHQPIDGEDSLDLAGSPDEVAAGLRAYLGAGFSHLIWVFRDPWDAETLAALPDVRARLA